MTYGVNSGLIFANPLTGIRAVFKKPKKENMAALPPEELPELMLDRKRQHQTHHPLPDRMAVAHDDSPRRGGDYSLGRH